MEWGYRGWGGVCLEREEWERILVDRDVFCSIVEKVGNFKVFMFFWGLFRIIFLFGFGKYRIFGFNI